MPYPPHKSSKRPVYRPAAKVVAVKPRKPSTTVDLECEVVPGLESFAYDEFAAFGERVTQLSFTPPDTLTLRYRGDLRELLNLRTVSTLYLKRVFPIPRPALLLTPEHLPALLAQIEQVRTLQPADAFRTFRISAAGDDSPTFLKIRQAISAQARLKFELEEADLLLRVRPVPDHEGWETLIRLSPRPLATRSWRVFNMLGALNATVAAAMIEVCYPLPRDRFLNIMSGSGTLLIERLRRCPARIAVGCDWDRQALRGSTQNVAAAHLTDQAHLLRANVTRLPFPAGSFDVICGDLPWGQMVGSHAQNEQNYPRLLRETARVAAPGAKMALLTHDMRLFETVIEAEAALWVLRDAIQVTQGGLHPRLYIFQRTTTPLV